MPLQPEAGGSPIEFPCDFPVKVFGEDTPEFAAVVFSIVSAHVPGLQKSAVTRNTSKKGRYVAITITFTASARDQLDLIYRELTAEPLVLMAL